MKCLGYFYDDGGRELPRLVGEIPSCIALREKYKGSDASPA
jgi:hypothetical protein